MCPTRNTLLAAPAPALALALAAVALACCNDAAPDVPAQSPADPSADPNAMDKLHGRVSGAKAPPLPSQEGAALSIVYPPSGAKVLHSLPLALSLKTNDPKLRMFVNPEWLYGLIDQPTAKRAQEIERDPKSVVRGALEAYRSFPDAFANGKHELTLQYATKNFSWGPAYSAKMKIEVVGGTVRPEVTLSSPALAAAGAVTETKAPVRVAFGVPVGFSLGAPADSLDLTRGYAVVIVFPGLAGAAVPVGMNVIAPAVFGACSSRPIGLLEPGTVRFPPLGATLQAAKGRCVALDKGQARTALPLEAGEHTLVVQLVDTVGNSLGAQYAAMTPLRVK